MSCTVNLCEVINMNEKKALNGTYTLYKEMKKAFPKIEQFFTPSVLSEFLDTSVHQLEKYNYGIGTMIRLKMLSRRNALYHEFVNLGYTDKELMSLEILKGFHKQKNLHDRS